MSTNTKLTTGQLVGLGAALFVLLCFFFPWIELNLLLASVNLSGFQLATGSGPAGSNFAGVPSLVLVPLSMVGVVAVVLACFFGQSSAGRLKGVASILLMGAGGVSALVILYQYFSLNQELNQNVLGMITQKVFSYSFGAHASLVGSVIVAGAGLLDLAHGTTTRGRQL